MIYLSPLADWNRAMPCGIIKRYWDTTTSAPRKSIPLLWVHTGAAETAFTTAGAIAGKPVSSAPVGRLVMQ